MRQAVLHLGERVLVSSGTTDSRYRTARRIFLGAFAFNTAITVFWLVTWLRGGSFFFSDYRVDWATLRRILGGVLFFYVIWGIPWWAIKSALLRYLVGFTKEERRDAFSSRMSRPYDVGALVAKYSERRIRIADMIGRRGRFLILACAGFYAQRLRVWGVGDVNRKSVAGTVAAFVAPLILCVGVVTAHGLGTPWLGLSLILAASNCLLELYSPRGTDDFTMGTANALICWAFGAWLY